MDASLPKKILVIDDDSAVCEGVENSLKKHGIQVVRALNLETAIYQFSQQIFEVAVIELEFAPLPGLALVQKFRANANKERKDIGIVIASGQQRKGSDDGLAGELGEIDFVNKPLNDIKLLPALQRALQRKRSVTDYEMVRALSFDAYRRDKNLEQAIAHVKANLPKLQMKGMALMANLYEEAGKHDEALKIVDAILVKKGDDITMNNAKGRLLMRLGNLQGARECLEKADKAAPRNLERIRAMASMFLKMQDPDASVGKMRELIELSPESPDMKFELFNDLETAGYMNHAIALCKETTLPAEVVRYYNNKGVLSSKGGETAKAINEYQAALKFFPNYRENYRIHFNVAIAEANTKTPESLRRAEAALLKCVALAPDFEKGKLLLQTVQAALQGSSSKAS